MVAAAASFIPTFGTSGIVFSGLTAAFAASDLDDTSENSVSNDRGFRHEKSSRESLYSERTEAHVSSMKPTFENTASAKTTPPDTSREEFFYEELWFYEREQHEVAEYHRDKLQKRLSISNLPEEECNSVLDTLQTLIEASEPGL